MILLPPDGPPPQPYTPPQPHSPPFPLPQHAPAAQPAASTSRTPVISPEDDIQRLFNVCKVGRNNAELLQEVLVYAKPQELRNDITKELLSRARASRELIGSQIPWATTEAEKSHRSASAAEQTTQEELLAALLASHEQLTECLKMYEDLERIAIEQEAEERLKTERLIQALTAVAEYSPTPEEAALVDWVISKGDPERTGKLNPQIATRIFSGSNLSPDALARIWEIASVDSKDGLLDRQGVGVALRLIGHAQKGEVVTEALVKRPGPIAVIDSPSSPLWNEPTAGPSSGIQPGSLPPLTSHDKAKFRKIFQSSGAQNGYVTGQQAREVFMKSKLPWDTLSRIWSLADIRQRGYLDVADFTVAMYLIQGLMTGVLSSLPQSLPPQLYQDAARNTPSPVPPQSLPPPPPAHPSRIPSSSRPSPEVAPPPSSGAPPPRHPSRVASQPSSPRWEITPATRVQAEHVFSSLDPRKRGRAKGEAVRTYLHQAGLSTNTAGRIWDLTDAGHKGYLTLDEFTVAMHLMKMRKEGQHLPSMLPPGALPGSTVSHDDEAYDGIARDLSHDRLSAGDARPPPIHIPSHSEDISRSASTLPGSSNIRASRSTPQLGSGPVSNPPVSPFATAPSTPFPASPFPGSTGYTPMPATAPSELNITPEERARYDRFFEQLDTSRKGYLLSDVAVPFFARAKLPNEVMATIWDLADSEHDGRLTRDDFAVAMHLIRRKLAGKELPTTVPASLLASSSRPEPSPSPPRQDSRPASQGTPPAPPPPPPRRASEPSGQVSEQTQQALPPLPDDADDDLIRSETPPPPYELIASESV
ncbi:EF-hand [Trametes coccinea BRFM310]|uniref:EF-hand n=1 Tax=Trametes coccinea (strain BRFM310) TaxID=1353009 RepID=A0A1Y2INV2_TRAC3|nr:EF-hand [Trametes coccinea BRFM310]